MRKFIYHLLAILIVTISCKKDGSSGTEITYEAKTTQGGFTQITYLDETASQTILSNISGDWKISFNNKAGTPRQLVVTAVTDVTTLPQPTITVNIYVNNSLVKTGSGEGVAFIDYNLN